MTATVTEWVSEPIHLSTADRHVQLPARHVHPAVADAALLVAERAAEYTAALRDRDAKQAEKLNLSNTLASSYATPLTLQQIAQRRITVDAEAAAAQDVANIMSNRLHSSFRDLTATAEQHRPEWLAYLHEQRRRNLAQLEAGPTPDAIAEARELAGLEYLATISSQHGRSFVADMVGPGNPVRALAEVATTAVTDFVNCVRHSVGSGEVDTDAA